MGGELNLLLDTHVLLWALGQPKNLTSAATESIQNPRNQLYVSAVTPFEIATKHRIGKLPGAEPILLAYEEHVARLGAGELSITARHGLVAAQLAWSHRDPFDRLLAAQSILEAMPLVSSDVAFDSVAGVLRIW